MYMRFVAVLATCFLGLSGCDSVTRPEASGELGSVAADATASNGDADVAAGELGTAEFGLSQRELRQAIENVEAMISKCMREQGFEYVAADFLTVKKGMSADKNLPGLSEEEFHSQHGFGVATLYSGIPPQLTEGYSPGKEGLGEKNIQIFKNLSPADRVAYNRALFGKNAEATFAVGLETEDFSQCGGCTRAAIEKYFSPEQLKSSYYNPKDALINKDPRMKAALREYASRMKDAGYNYNHPDEVESDIRDRLQAITGGESIPRAEMSGEQRTALEKLADYERQVATVSFQLQEEIFDPVEEQIEKELFAREVK